MRITNTGPHDRGTILIDGVLRPIERGETIDVKKATGEALLKTPYWTKPKKKEA